MDTRKRAWRTRYRDTKRHCAICGAQLPRLVGNPGRTFCKHHASQQNMAKARSMRY